MSNNVFDSSRAISRFVFVSVGKRRVNPLLDRGTESVELLRVVNDTFGAVISSI